MTTTVHGSVPLTAFASDSSGNSVGETGLSLSPLQSYDDLKDGLDAAEHEESAAQLAVRRYSGESQVCLRAVSTGGQLGWWICDWVGLE